MPMRKSEELCFIIAISLLACNSWGSLTSINAEPKIVPESFSEGTTFGQCFRRRYCFCRSHKQGDESR